MLLKQVVGQQENKKVLLHLFGEGRLPHALLFLGKEGRGGLPLALAFAQYIFCTNKQGDDACGTCSDCNKASRLEHADLHISFPAISPKSNTKALSRYFIQEFREFIAQMPYGTTYDWLQFINAENKQGNIPAEECREIIDTLNLKSYEGGKKIQIIWRPEYLGKEGNILLKLLEEPPADTFLILVAENTEDILPTILSRMQSFRLTPLSVADIAQALTERSLTDSKRAAQIGHLSEGSFTHALQLVRHAENDLFPEVKRWFNAIFTNNGLEISKLADEWSKNGREQQKNLLSYVIQLLEQTIRKRYIPDIEPMLVHEESQFVSKLAANKISFEAISKMIKHISNTIYHIERNAHGKTQLHALSLQMLHSLHD